MEGFVMPAAMRYLDRFLDPLCEAFTP